MVQSILNKGLLAATAYQIAKRTYGNILLVLQNVRVQPNYLYFVKQLNTYCDAVVEIKELNDEKTKAQQPQQQGQPQPRSIQEIDADIVKQKKFKDDAETDLRDAIAEAKADTERDPSGKKIGTRAGVADGFFKELEAFLTGPNYTGTSSPLKELNNALRAAGFPDDDKLSGNIPTNMDKRTSQGLITYEVCLRHIEDGDGHDKPSGSKLDWIELGFVKLLHETRPTARIDATGRKDMIDSYYDILNEKYGMSRIRFEYNLAWAKRYIEKTYGKRKKLHQHLLDFVKTRKVTQDLKNGLSNLF